MNIEDAKKLTPFEYDLLKALFRIAQALEALKTDD